MNITSKLRLGAVVLAMTAMAASPSFAQGENNEGVTPSFTPQSGWWWNPNEPGGQGVVLEVNGSGGIFASALAYDETGRASWYVIKTRPNNGSQIGELQKFVGGHYAGGNYRENQFVGFADLASFSFDSPTSGTLSLSTGTIPLRRYDIIANGVAAGPAAGAPRGGWWWSAEESGAGYFLEAQGDNMFFAAVMYNDLGEPTWYSARGSMVSPTLFSGQMTETYGGQQLGGTYHHPATVTPVGNVTIQFATDTTGTLVLPNGRQLPLTRYTF